MIRLIWSFLAISRNVHPFACTWTPAFYSLTTLLQMHLSFVPIKCFPCKRNIILLIFRGTVNNAIISYLLNHLGYIDSTTTVSFHHNLLFPSIPSDPQFVHLPGCSFDHLLSIYPSNSPSIHSYTQLKDILTWNIYVHQNAIYSQLHSEEDNEVPFVWYKIRISWLEL